MSLMKHSNNTNCAVQFWKHVRAVIWKKGLSDWHTYLPSPPHAPFGMTITSLQVSVCVLYTSSFRGFPSWASISEKKSSDCKSTLWINRNSHRCRDKKQSSVISHILQQLVSSDNVVAVRLKARQRSRWADLHVLQERNDGQNNEFQGRSSPILRGLLRLWWRNSPEHARHSHWLPGSCRSARWHPAGPVRPTGHWEPLTAPAPAWFWCCTPPFAPSGRCWLSAPPSADRFPHSGQQSNWVTNYSAWQLCTCNSKQLRCRAQSNRTYKSSVVQGQNEVKKRLQSSLFCGGTWLNLSKITALFKKIKWRFLKFY